MTQKCHRCGKEIVSFDQWFGETCPLTEQCLIPQGHYLDTKEWVALPRREEKKP